MKIKCFNCGKTFTEGNDEDGLPNGLGLVMSSGRRYDICKNCVSNHNYEASVKIQQNEKENK